MSERHLDPRISGWGMGPTEEYPWAVVCPRCEHRAQRIVRRLVCTHCALDRTSASRPEALWLETDCCGERLFAVNERHLELLEGYLLAGLRERRRDPVQGWSNQSVTSRLPRWMKAAKNRDEVRRALLRLRERLSVA